ncbi:MAG: stalk domain-containing protein [bacterium]
MKNKKNKIILSFMVASLITTSLSTFYIPKVVYASSISTDVFTKERNQETIYDARSTNSDYYISLKIGSDSAYIDGQEVKITTAPYLLNGNTMIPINIIISALNIPLSDVNYSGDNQEVSIKYNGNYISFSINSTQIKMYSSQTTTLDIKNNAKVEMVNSNVFLPIAEVCEIFEMEYVWDASTQVATLKGVQSEEEFYSEETTLRDFEEEVVKLVNIERAKRGLQPMVIYEPAMTLAKIKSKDMADRDYIAHINPSGVYLAQMLNATQSLAGNYMTPEEVVNAWMSSWTDRLNILNPYNFYIGVGLAEGTNTSTYDLYWTQVYLSDVSRITN